MLRYEIYLIVINAIALSLMYLLKYMVCICESYLYNWAWRLTVTLSLIHFYQITLGVLFIWEL